MHLRGATALVTGAAQGLGKAFSEALLARGASVCLSDVQDKKGKEVESEFQKKYGSDKATFIQCDVRSEENVSKMFQEAVSRLGHIDLMVNNAGIGNESQVKNMIDINLLAVIKGTHQAIDHMRKDQGGRGGTIINVASAAGLTPVYLSPSYAATKYGVVGFTLSWASNPHIQDMGVQLACMCPAFTDTAIIQDFTTSPYPEEAKKLILDMGLNKVEVVTKAFMTLVESDKCNGDIIKAFNGNIEYHMRNGKPVKRSKL